MRIRTRKALPLAVREELIDLARALELDTVEYAWGDAEFEGDESVVNLSERADEAGDTD